jgi:hypothetical protein
VYLEESITSQSTTKHSTLAEGRVESVWSGGILGGSHIDGSFDS